MEAQNMPAAMLRWLNDQEKNSEEAWLLILFRSVLTMIRRQQPVRLDTDGLLTASFWKHIEERLEYSLLEHKKPKAVNLYQFFHRVADQEKWLLLTSEHAYLTEEAERFLSQKKEAQLAVILYHFFPEP
ncbi:hypothetical protein [Geomicrobium sp. JCM 19039]|uniref:hypothetical protein n=1 Tax=Geomicrobium sp. JCM 19039 TaxID=1460636 RepID=UPI00045F2019|nr:hypothetical protein [Geomicrobium sp. JCM 19039]GAK12881.1 hypothetical protein JCM19039_2687 [Geomicrobium sp. JCM 19039]